jgi:glutaredoxin-like protein NrdH
VNFDLFTKVDGEKHDKVLVLIGLSTCGFCKRAKTLLDDENWSYSFVFIDNMKRDDRILLKRELKSRFTSDLIYPFLIINNEDFLNGFNKDQWIQKLS